MVAGVVCLIGLGEGRTLVLPPIVFGVTFLALWEAAVKGFDLRPYFLPPPSVVFETAWQFRGALWRNGLVTLWTTLAGFGLAVGREPRLHPVQCGAGIA